MVITPESVSEYIPTPELAKAVDTLISLPKGLEVMSDVLETYFLERSVDMLAVDIAAAANDHPKAIRVRAELDRNNGRLMTLANKGDGDDEYRLAKHLTGKANLGVFNYDSRKWLQERYDKEMAAKLPNNP